MWEKDLKRELSEQPTVEERVIGADTAATYPLSHSSHKKPQK